MKHNFLKHFLITVFFGVGLLLSGVVMAGHTGTCYFAHEAGSYCELGATITGGKLQGGVLIYNHVPVACTSSRAGAWVASGGTFTCAVSNGKLGK